MRKTKFSEEQIIGVIREAEAGRPVKEVARAHGITETTFYRWKAKYGGLPISEAKRLRQLEDENRRLKHVVADLTLDNQALKGLLGKKWYRPRRAATRRSWRASYTGSASGGPAAWSGSRDRR